MPAIPSYGATGTSYYLRDALLVFGVALICYTWALGASPLALTEGHRVVTAHQMVESGDWIVPTMYGRLYVKKPPLFYWVLASVEYIGGFADEWVWRLPSAFASALLAAALCVLTARWFDRRAGVVAGFAIVGLIALWEQSRSAEIDAMNTLCSVLAALAVVELAYGRNLRTWMWTIGAGLMIGASLLLKGHAGLPVILGAMIGPPIALKTIAGLQRPAVWFAWGLGIVLFGAWLLALTSELGARGIGPDMSGIAEAVETLHLTDQTRILRAGIVPLLLVLYSFPLSLAVPLCWKMPMAIAEHQKRLLKALAATICASMLIFLVAGTTNPRYELLILPLLAPCAGGLAMAVEKEWLPSRMMIGLDRLWRATGVLITIGHVALAALVWPYASSHVAVGLSCLCAVVLAVVWIRGWTVGRLFAHGMILIGMVVIFTVPFSEMQNHRKFERSSYVQAREIRQYIGAGAQIATDRMLLVKPEFFYYLDVIVKPRSVEDMAGLEAGTWLMLNSAEWQIWNTRFPEKSNRHICFMLYKDAAHLVQLGPRLSTAQPDHPFSSSLISCVSAAQPRS